MKLKQSDIKPLRERWAKEQDLICPLFENKYPLSDFVLDHSHQDGYCRGSIHRNANQIEGKIRKAFQRFGGASEIDLPKFLINLAKYLLDNHSDEHIIHPTFKRKKKTKKKKTCKTKRSSKKKSTPISKKR